MSNIYTPYTYLIGWSKHRKFYYGVRFAHNCHPLDLWKTYFTSSKHVKKFRSENGEPDIIQIRKTFVNKISAINWEKEVLRKMDVLNNQDRWLNKNINGAILNIIHPRGMLNKHHSSESNSKRREKLKDKTYEEIYGTYRAKEEKDKRSKALKNKPKPYLKNKTYEEIFGKDRAAELKRKKSENTKGIKRLKFKKPQKIKCDHCDKFYDPGNLTRHKKRISTTNPEPIY